VNFVTSKFKLAFSLKCISVYLFCRSVLFFNSGRKIAFIGACATASIVAAPLVLTAAGFTSGGKEN